MPKAGSGGETRVGGRAIRMTVGEPGVRKLGRPPTDWWTLFTEAGTMSRRGKRPWICMAAWGSRRSADRVRRQIRNGDVDVPGGAEAWEIDVRTAEDGVGGELWVRKGP